MVVQGGRLLTVRQVADALGVCTALVYRLVEQGELPHTRISNAIRISAAVVEDYVRRRHGAPP